MQQANTSSKRRALALALALAMSPACGSDEGSGTSGMGGAGGMTGGVGGATGGAGGATGGMGGATGGMGGVAGMMVSGGMGGMTGGAGGATGGSGGMGTGGMGTGGMGTGGMGTGGMGTGGMGTGGMSGGDFTLTSPAITGGMLAAANRCADEDPLFGEPGPSPALMWTGAPTGTMSFALTLTDNSNDFAHWTIWDIPASATSLPAMVATGGMPAMPAGAKQGANTTPLAGPGYFGPCGTTPNPYEFTLYAIDAATLGVEAGATRAAVQAAIDMHDLGSVSVVGMSGP